MENGSIVSDKTESALPIEPKNDNIKNLVRKDPQTPGQHLRKMREMRHLSIEEVSKHLLLSKKIIQDLENDDFSKIAAPIYAKGYLRSYAQFLRIPEETIMESFARLEPTVGSGIDTKKVTDYVSGNFIHTKKIRWIGYGFFALLIFLTVAWIWGGHSAGTNDKASQNLVSDTMQTNTDDKSVSNGKVPELTNTSQPSVLDVTVPTASTQAPLQSSEEKITTPTTEDKSQVSKTNKAKVKDNVTVKGEDSVKPVENATNNDD